MRFLCRRLKDLDLSIDDHALRDTESLISDRFSVDGKGSSPARTHFVLSLDDPFAPSRRSDHGSAGEAAARERAAAAAAAAAEDEVIRLRAELRAARERADELEAANQLLSSQLLEKEVLRSDFLAFFAHSLISDHL